MKWLKISMLAGSAAAFPVGAMAEAHLASDYCESAFLAGDQDADGFLSDAEIDAMRDAVFGQLDMNSDGSIDREEFVACTGQSSERIAGLGQGMMGAPEDLAALDANEDGAIDRKEYFDSAAMAYQTAFDSGSDDKTWAEKFVYLGDDVNAGDEMDFEQFFAQVGAKYDGVDADGDRMIVADEWSQQGQSITENRMIARYEIYDIDGNGIVDAGEFQERMTLNFVNAAEDAARDGFTDTSKGVPVKSWYQEAL